MENCVGGQAICTVHHRRAPPLQLGSEHWQPPGFDNPAAHRADGQYRYASQSASLNRALLAILIGSLLPAGENARATVPGMFSQTLPGAEFGPAAPPSELVESPAAEQT